MKKYTFADYGFQFITVTAGVLIALFIDGLAERNSNRELVESARATILLEIADNKKDLEIFRARVMDVSALVKLQEDFGKKLLEDYSAALKP